MKKTKGWVIIANAIIWGAVIVGCSLKLKGTGCYGEIQNILAAGAVVSLIVIGGLLLGKDKSE